VTPWLLARFGLRRTYIAANLLLMMGGIVGGLAQDYNLLIAMRAVEGVAAGILQPIPAIVIMRGFAPGEQGRAMGVFGLGVVLAPATGPALGGFLVDHFGWRSIFFVVVPFCLVAVALTRAFLPMVSSFVQGRKPLDWFGVALISLSSVSLLNGLAELNRANTLQPWVLLGLGAAGLAAFVVYQLRRTEPLLQLRLFQHRAFAMGGVVQFIYGFGIFGSTYLLPIFLQMALGYTPSQAGLVLLPAGLALAVTMPFAGRLADRLPAAPLVVTGVMLLAASMALTATVTTATAYALVIAWAMIGRIGLGVIHPALSIGSVKGLAAPELPQALSMGNFVRQLGGSFGISGTGVLLDWRLTANAGKTQPAFEETFFILAAVSLLAAVAGWFIASPTAPSAAAAPPAR
jgi:MFS transporter, DHA2 family, multidrug resistance protein